MSSAQPRVNLTRLSAEGKRGVKRRIAVSQAGCVVKHRRAGYAPVIPPEMGEGCFFVVLPLMRERQTPSAKHVPNSTQSQAGRLAWGVACGEFQSERSLKTVALRQQFQAQAKSWENSRLRMGSSGDSNEPSKAMKEPDLKPKVAVAKAMSLQKRRRNQHPPCESRKSATSSTTSAFA